MDSLVGTSLGGYTIIRFLGSGGMGAVYLAEDSAIGQQVAIKIVRTDSGDSPDMAATMKGTGEVRGKMLRGKVHALALSPHGNYLAAGLESGFIVIENLLEPISQPLTFPAYTGSVRALAWSVDGSMLAAGGTNTSAQILDATTGQMLRTLPHSTAVYGVAWDPINTSLLATASVDGTVNIWHTNSGSRIVYRGHKGAATAVAWSASGLASGSADKNIIVWKV